jgi:TetR/AcrR family transcriptional regulator, regulator of cefoperazone and chloramphenicol sensitivity
MGRDGTATRERLLDAAEHLFARQGVDAVTIREINDRAGQRNASALHYHFGSREQLLVAVVERHQPAIDAERARLLAAAGDDPHDVVHAILTPLIDRLRTPDGRDYLRIVPQLLGPGHRAGDLPQPAALVDGLERLEPHLAALRPAARSQRLLAMLLATTTLLADRAARLETGARPPLRHAAFARELVAMATGMVLAPPASGSPRAERRGSTTPDIPGTRL